MHGEQRSELRQNRSGGPLLRRSVLHPTRTSSFFSFRLPPLLLGMWPASLLFTLFRRPCLCNPRLPGCRGLPMTFMGTETLQDFRAVVRGGCLAHRIFAQDLCPAPHAQLRGGVMLARAMAEPCDECLRHQSGEGSAQHRRGPRASGVRGGWGSMPFRLARQHSDLRRLLLLSSVLPSPSALSARERPAPGGPARAGCEKPARRTSATPPSVPCAFGRMLSSCSAPLVFVKIPARRV